MMAHIDAAVHPARNAEHRCAVLILRQVQLRKLAALIGIFLAQLAVFIAPAVFLLGVGVGVKPCIQGFLHQLLLQLGIGLGLLRILGGSRHCKARQQCGGQCGRGGAAQIRMLHGFFAFFFSHSTNFSMAAATPSSLLVRVI